jgi:GH15 family glucan-1,4-alpha-glucosidase
MQTIENRLTVKTDIGGICRYENDYYQKPDDVKLSTDIPGNPWIITTLWLANFYISTAKKLEDLEKPKRILEWVTRQQNDAGILPEQIHPLTGAPLSVAPLTWSHSTFIDTVLQFEKKFKKLKK